MLFNELCGCEIAFETAGIQIRGISDWDGNSDFVLCCSNAEFVINGWVFDIR